MNPSDQELLKTYAESRVQSAFAVLVQRHLPLVYAVARRQVGGDAQLAADVAQSVFTALAQKAGNVSACPSLSGWLIRATHFAASDVVRKERRRRAREWEAHMHQLDSADDSVPVDPERLRGAVDAALTALPQRDRDAVTLRFFEAHGFAAIGEKLRISEDAARMRVDRALARLRQQLERAGVRTSAALLITTMADAGTGFVPPELTGQIARTAVGSVASAGLFPVWPLTSAVVATVALTVGGLWLNHSSAGALHEMERRRVSALTALERAEGELRARREVLRAAEEDNAQLQNAFKNSSFAAIVNPGLNRMAFVVDTSGSMRDPKSGYVHAIVSETMESTLLARPEAREFYLLDTDGRSIASASGRVWFKNDPEGRAEATTALRTYNQDSMSNPVPGIESALNLLDGLRDPRSHLEIMVLGDEHVGRRDAATAQLDRINATDNTGRRQVKISAVAFPTWLGAPAPERWQHEKPPTFILFERLMREIAARHGGSYSDVADLNAR